MHLLTLTRHHPPAHGRRGRAAITTGICCLLLVPTACARKDFNSEIGRTRSWMATVKLAGQQRGVGATNDAVTRQLLDRAIEARSREAELLARYAVSDSQRVAAGSLLDSLDEQILQLQRAMR